VDGGVLRVEVDAGEVLDEVVLRSYCTGAAHQALGWVTSEGLAVAPDGEVLDLTVRSFGVVRAVDLPPIEVVVRPGEGPAVRAGDAVFAAVAGAVWVAQGCPQDLPTGRSIP
jgi:CO/xanthine dehydrogenase Mo-binding subunit